MRELFTQNEGTYLNTSLKMREFYLAIIQESTSIFPQKEGTSYQLYKLNLLII